MAYRIMVITADFGSAHQGSIPCGPVSLTKRLYNMNDLFVAITAILGVVALFVLFSLLLAFPVMWLWNWLMPVIFKLPTLTVWQAWGLNVLTSFLFKSSHISSNKK